MPRNTSSSSATILDASCLFGASEVIAERVGRARVTIDYTKLRVRLDTLRRDAGWRAATVNAALLSMDPASEGQQRFLSMLRHSGFEVHDIHYRDTFISLPPGRSTAELTGKPIISMASRIAYIAGLMARHSDTNLLVVSHAFELCAPLTDLCQRVPAGKVGIAFFGSLMDYRWKATGLFDGGPGPVFFDLDAFGEELLDVNLTGRSNAAPDARSGLSRF